MHFSQMLSEFMTIIMLVVFRNVEKLYTIKMFYVEMTIDFFSNYFCAA